MESINAPTMAAHTHTHTHASNLTLCAARSLKKESFSIPFLRLLLHVLLVKGRCSKSKVTSSKGILGVPGNRRKKTIDTQPKHVGEGRPARDSRPLKQTYRAGT